MPNDEFAHARRADQLALLTGEHDGVAWDSEDRDDFSYLYDPDVLLVRTDDTDRVHEVRNALNEAEVFVGEVGEPADEEELPPPEQGERPDLMVRRLPLPRRRDGDPRAVPLALEILDDLGLNTEEESWATPDHWIHLSSNTRLCPATEPEHPGKRGPWPKPSPDQSRGHGVTVSVVDSGWHDPAAHLLASKWLKGVHGDDEYNGPTLRPYAGHGTFIAGVIRCVAPGTQVFVERFIHGGFALRESSMVRQIQQALGRLDPPQLINLSAGATTRKKRPLLSFERLWANHLSQLGESCLLVAAAGNDATADPLWPAAFEWALGVGSLDHNGDISDFSNIGRSADVYAVGRNLVNAFPQATYVCRETPDKGKKRHLASGLARWSGTSFAAPVVVGLIAAELGEGTDVLAARDAVLKRGTLIRDPDGGTKPALLPPYT